MPTSTSLVTNLPADFNTFGQGVDTSMAQLKGGTTGQVLSKTSGTDMAFTWVTPTDQTPLTTKGDLFAFSTVDARLAVGANETRLVADSTQTVGLKYVADTTNYAINAKADLLVGTAADTLAALTVGTNGQVLTADSTVSPTGLKWATPAVSASGLTKIGSTNTFSSVASVTIDSIFSSTYKTYLVSFDNIYAATGADDLLMQLVYSGTAQASGYYGAVPYGTYDSASYGNIQNNNSTSFTLMQDCSGQYGDALTVWFQQVGNISQEGRFHGTGFSRQGVKAHTFGGTAATDRTYTGIKIFSSSTNITGNISVYGLA
jgi:hypothetical protein